MIQVPFPLWGLSHLTTGPCVLFGLAALAAVLDWIAVSGFFTVPWLEYLAKPATLVFLVVMGALVTTPNATERELFVIALGFCLLGDIFLMLPGDRTETFGAGLGSFFVAQLLFTIGVTHIGADLDRTLVALGILVVLAAGPGWLVLRAVRRGDRPSLAYPVVLYMSALLVMAATAWSAALSAYPYGRNLLLGFAASIFVISDTTLALNRFVRSHPRGTLVVHATYHVAVALLVLSLAGFSLPSSAPLTSSSPGGQTRARLHHLASSQPTTTSNPKHSDTASEVRTWASGPLAAS
jgi:uncharacterized membrane protein YhhN